VYYSGTHIQTQKEYFMRLEDLAARLVAVEAKLATLTGTAVNTDNATSIEELDARLSVVEVQVDQLIVEKTQSHIDAIVYSPADEAPVAVETVVAISPSADHAEAADIVADVVAAQHEADAIINPEVADIVAAAVIAVVVSEPEVVTDPVALTAAIVEAVADMPTPAPEAVEQVVAAVADIIATATGVDVVTPEVQQQIAEAVAMPADPRLDVIEQRLDIAEAKVDSLLGK
jgi:tetrahydromethanopterin S-methyltransferase subunit G